MGEVDEIDMLVSGRDRFQLDARGPEQLAWLTREVSRQSTITDQLDVNPGFLLHLPQGGLIRQLIRLDMTTRRQPAPELGMVMQQNTPFTHHENRHREISGDMNVWTGHVNGRALATAAIRGDTLKTVITWRRIRRTPGGRGGAVLPERSDVRDHSGSTRWPLLSTKPWVHQEAGIAPPLAPRPTIPAAQADLVDHRLPVEPDAGQIAWSTPRGSLLGPDSRPAVELQ